MVIFPPPDHEVPLYSSVQVVPAGAAGLLIPANVKPAFTLPAEPWNLRLCPKDPPVDQPEAPATPTQAACII